MSKKTKTQFWGYKLPKAGWFKVPDPAGRELTPIFDDREKALAFAGLLCEDDPAERRMLAGAIKRLKPKSLRPDDLVGINPASMGYSVAMAVSTWEEIQERSVAGEPRKPVVIDARTGRQTTPPELKEGQVVVLFGGVEGPPAPIIVTNPEDGDRCILAYTSHEKAMRALATMRSRDAAGAGGAITTSSGVAIVPRIAPSIDEVAALALAVNESGGDVDGVALNMFAGDGGRFAFVRIKEK